MDRRAFLQGASALIAALPGFECGGEEEPAGSAIPVEWLTDQLAVARGPVNGGLLLDGNRVLGIPGDPRPEGPALAMRLFTSPRRDAQWPGLPPAGPPSEAKGPKAGVPTGAQDLFQDPERFWAPFREDRFHDYALPSTHVLTRPVPEAEGLSAGTILEWGEATIEVLATPGYSPEGTSYLVETGGRLVAFTGDLLYGDGQLLDLHSLQDGIPAADLRGYHGYMARAADLISSLETLIERNPGVVVPARGPLIREPASSARQLIQRLRRIYESYLSTTALRWYFGEDHIRTCAERILAPDGPAGSVPVPAAVAEARTRKPPSWIVPIQNARLLVSQGGTGWLVDCGYEQIIAEVDRRIQQGELSGIDGIYVTHYHDDHTDRVQQAADHFGCPVYCCAELASVLRHPERYRLPALSDQPIRTLEVMEEGAQKQWHEYTLTFSYFPGQTRYHGGLKIERGGGEEAGGIGAERPVFFAGDSFTPTGLDDYCMGNRNLMHPGTGYLYCLDRLAEMDPLPWIVNQHVEPIFRFTRAQLRALARAFRARRELIGSAVPWEDPNYGTDAGWARCDPYQLAHEEAGPDRLEVRIFNHAPEHRTFAIEPHAPEGWAVKAFEQRARVEARSEGSMQIELEPAATPPPTLAVLTVDVSTPDRTLRGWAEALLARS